ncbi:MAG TPA: hypothetical protein VKR58_09570 [Aquella sp.]|nr:hypothetical protein [Aquella sp.]
MQALVKRILIKKSYMSELIRTERFISFFNVSDDDMVGEINVDAIPLEKLITIVKANEDDLLLYDQYPLDQNQLTEKNNLLPKIMEFDQNKYEYFLECGGIYDYNLKK